MGLTGEVRVAARTLLAVIALTVFAVPVHAAAQDAPDEGTGSAPPVAPTISTTISAVAPVATTIPAPTTTASRTRATTSNSEPADDGGAPPTTATMVIARPLEPVLDAEAEAALTSTTTTVARRRVSDLMELIEPALASNPDAERAIPDTAIDADAPSIEGVVQVVEFVLPEPAARVAVSPFVIADVLLRAMFRTGQGMSLPAAGAGMVVGFLVVGARARSDAVDDEL